MPKKRKQKAQPSFFLKSPYKMEFYQIDKNLNVNPLTFLEAAQLFEAQSVEPAFGLPEQHYKQVQAALDSFEKDFFGSMTETVTTTDKADAISSQAKKFLREVRGYTKKDEVKIVCTNLLELIDKGTFYAASK